MQSSGLPPIELPRQRLPFLKTYLNARGLKTSLPARAPTGATSGTAARV